NELKIEVAAVRVTELKENTFYAEIEIKDNNGRIYFIDARPSDSIALALKTKTPIFVSESVMNSAAIQADQMPESDVDRLSELNRQLQSAVAEEAYERAAQLRDEIHDLEKKLFKKSDQGKGESDK
ncbi:MAG: bifunctional nuclease family protein, partial [Candidatus Marinimicrobia bacterium]|nr:bifunctional nuclease family protein [Candidatus Neomarinimicrobiota bacterium]